MAQNSVKALELSIIDSVVIDTTYQSLNSAGFAHPIFFLRIINDSNEAVTISYDGVNDNDYIPANSVLEVPAQANAQPNARYALFNAYTQVYVKGDSGTGVVVMTGYYV